MFETDVMWAAYHIAKMLEKPDNITSLLYTRAKENPLKIWNNDTGFFETRNASGAWGGPDNGWTEGDYLSVSLERATHLGSKAPNTYIYTILFRTLKNLLTSRGGNLASCKVWRTTTMAITMRSRTRYSCFSIRNLAPWSKIHSLPYTYLIYTTMVGLQWGRKRGCVIWSPKTTIILPKGSLVWVCVIDGTNYTQNLFLFRMKTAVKWVPFTSWARWECTQSVLSTKTTPWRRKFFSFGVLVGKDLWISKRPFHDKLTIDLPQLDGSSKRLSITSPGALKNQYVKSITLNGQPLDKPFLAYEQFIGGGDIVYELSDKPETFGNDPEIVKTLGPYVTVPMPTWKNKVTIKQEMDL